MSRQIKTNEQGETVITVDDEERCKHLYNEKCCNAESDMYRSFTSGEACEKCPLFEKEDFEDIIERLKYWLFQRRDCKYCCLWCEFYDMCRIDFSGNRRTGRRRKKKMSKSRANKHLGG